jgi:hypothetical protein
MSQEEREVVAAAIEWARASRASNGERSRDERRLRNWRRWRNEDVTRTCPVDWAAASATDTCSDPAYPAGAVGADEH